MSGFLRASFVGALLFTPAMADDVEQVHEEALRVLRKELGQANPAPGAPAPATIPAADPELARMRAEREARIKAEAQERMAEREKMQAERRVQFEQFVKERERLRQEQRAYDERAARQTGQLPASGGDDLHARALQALHQAQAQQAVESSSGAELPAAAVASSAPAVKVEAPQVMAAAPSSALSPSQVDSSVVHAKALEVLRQTQASPSGDSSPAPKPSPELQKRLQDMQAELEQEQIQKARGSSSISDTYIHDLERRAQISVQAGAAATPSAANAASVPAASPALDSGTREIIERQNREISERLGSGSLPAASAPAAARGLSTQEETRARDALHQAEAGAVMTTQPASAPASRQMMPEPAIKVPPPAVTGGPAVTHTTVSDSTDVQYSKELEERARQVLVERARAGAAPAPQAAMAAPAAAASPQAGNPASAPASAANANADVHARALDALNQTRSAGAPGRMTPSKMERLKELTDLYRADRIGPAEYHQKRAQIIAEP
jgi:hypothetical protein